MIQLPPQLRSFHASRRQAYRRALSAEKAFLGCMNYITALLLLTLSFGGLLLIKVQAVTCPYLGYSKYATANFDSPQPALVEFGFIYDAWFISDIVYSGFLY